MTEEKKITSIDLSEGQVPSTINKAIEFGAVPAKMNMAGQAFQGVNVQTPGNPSEAIRAMVPESLPKIPLNQLSPQPPQPSTSSSESSSSKGTGDGDKK